MRRTIQKELEDPIAQLLLENQFPQGAVFRAGSRGSKIRIKVQAPDETTELKAAEEKTAAVGI
jgi:ATP-dependent Clp protease ATP-binding subunit ClpA